MGVQMAVRTSSPYGLRLIRYSDKMKALASVRTLPLGRPDGHKGKLPLTSVKLPKSSLSQNLSFLEQYIADLALYNSFHVRINILQ
jgi:hypothetical protein